MTDGRIAGRIDHHCIVVNFASFAQYRAYADKSGGGNFREKRAALWGAAPLLKDSTPVVNISREECPNKIEQFRNSVNWYRGKNRITVEAKTACGSKLGDAYELSDVKIEIRSGDRLITQAHSAFGEFWMKSNEILIGKSDQQNKKACVSKFDLMKVDLKSGEMRTPGMQAFLNSTGLIPCVAPRKFHG
jgi:hypothetical protein